MTARLQSLWHNLLRRDEREVKTPSLAAVLSQRAVVEAVEISPNDPLLAYFQSNHGLVEVDRLNLDSSALNSLKAAGVKIAIPLVGQGELIGLLNLGPRLSEQDYSADDHKLLNDLAVQAAPALRRRRLRPLTHPLRREPQPTTRPSPHTPSPTEERTMLPTDRGAPYTGAPYIGAPLLADLFSRCRFG